ncbi:MAG: flagellar biosynthetic protein FliR [Terriglobales bacterium]|jgi:flagellar biosynthetic protein FliR
MNISVANILSAVMIIGIRVSGLMMFAPFFSNAVIPPRVKVILTVAITAVLYPVFAPRFQTLDLSRWPMIVGTETVLGLAIGVSTFVVFEAAQIAGQMLSIQMGYSLVNILDPNTQVESTVVAFFHQSMALLIFLSLDVHHWILRAVAHSFEYLPPGTVTLNPRFAQTVLHEGAIILELGIQIAAPVLAATLLMDLILGLLGKASPQMPLMLLGPAVKSMLGVLILTATIGFWPRVFEKYFGQSIVLTEQVLHLAH